MHNVHAHTWDQALHFDPATVHEADLSRGRSLDLTVRFDDFITDMAPFDRVIVFGLKGRLTGYWVPDAFVADFVAQAPEKLVGFAGCEPTQPGYMDELTHAVEDLGLQGLKLGPIYAGFDPRDPCCDPVYEYCQARGLPVVFHTGTTFNRVAPLGVSRPWLFDEVALRYPEMRMMLAHLGHPWYGECLAVIRKHPHVYADISALFYRPWQFYNMLITAQEYNVTHKLLFGTDYPFAGTQESIDGLRNVNAATGTSGLPRITDENIESLLTRDALSLLGVPQ
ncbi:MAG: amidohydrolase family protein [Anaerolineae bacterium]|nr:amidohydrolase family protein [Anaerolineae bacterium]